MRFSPVRPGIYTATLDEQAVNVTLVVGDRRALLVDTGTSPQEGTSIREAVRRTTDVPLEVVVLTHGHWDHAFGLRAFAGLDTVGQANLPEDLRCAENRQRLAERDIRGDAVVVPDTLYDLLAVRDLGGLSVEIAHFGPAHTRSDLIVAVPERSTLVVGDLVEAGPPQFDETSSLRGWVQSLDALHGLLKHTTVVVPGHGSPLGPDEVTRFRSGLAALQDQAEYTFQQGVPADQAYGYDKLEWPWDRDTVHRAIEVAYRELSA